MGSLSGDSLESSGKLLHALLITHLPAPPSVGTGAGRQGFQNRIKQISRLFQKSPSVLLSESISTVLET
jgi:hypothetical protein